MLFLIKFVLIINEYDPSLVATPILYYLVVNNRSDTNVFTNIVSLYLIGYFMYQKPVIKM